MPPSLALHVAYAMGYDQNAPPVLCRAEPRHFFLDYPNNCHVERSEAKSRHLIDYQIPLKISFDTG